MHRARARVVDQVVDHHAAHAALEQRVALVVVRVEVADDQDVAGVVVDQRALRMLALRVGRVRQALGDDVVAEGDAMRRAFAPSSGVLPAKRGPEADRFSSVAQVMEQWSTITSCAPWP